MSERYEPPRLAPLAPEEWGDEEYSAYGSLLGIPGERVPRVGSGHPYDPLNFSVVGTFVRHPEMAKAFWVFNGYQLQRSTLPLRFRARAILRVAHRRQSGYEWGQRQQARGRRRDHRRGDQAARTGNDGFAGTDLLILEATDELLGQDTSATTCGPGSGGARRAPGDGPDLPGRHLRHAGDGLRHLAADPGNRTPRRSRHRLPAERGAPSRTRRARHGPHRPTRGESAWMPSIIARTTSSKSASGRGAPRTLRVRSAALDVVALGTHGCREARFLVGDTDDRHAAQRCPRIASECSSPLSCQRLNQRSVTAAPPA